LYTGIAGTISITINGQTCSSFVSDGFYVVEINGKNLNIHKMNEPANVLLTATLTDAQYNGTEALTLNITESGWNCVQISHILGTLAVENAEEPETPVIPDEPEVWGPIAISGVMAKTTSNASYDGAQLIMTGAADKTYTFTLSKVKFCNYSEVSMITVFGQANSGYTFKAYGTTFVNTSIVWNWLRVVKVGAEGKTVKNTDTGADIVLSEGYYLTIGNTDVGSEWYKYVKLSDAVVNGEEGLTFTVTTSDGNWDWMKFRQDGSVETDNFAGTLA
jgi:drug/metabolite transporter superfamily protein YnfA